jgi:capsular exopolysaccharide synthesis family protein
VACIKPQLREDSRLVALSDGNSLGAEKFRLLRARLRHLREKQQLRRIVITSAVPGEGKTLVSMNLAVTLARHSSEKVLLLEGDLRKPRIAEHMCLQGSPGVDDWIALGEPISNFIYRLEDLPLYLLPAGVPRENPLAILQSARFLALYQQLSAAFDWILIDAPPMLPMADVSFWSRQADGLMIVAREGRTPKKILQKGLEFLDNPKLIGIVLNDAHAIERSYYYHYYNSSRQAPQKVG